MWQFKRPRKVWLLPVFIRENAADGFASTYFVLTITLLFLAFTLGGSSQAGMIGNTLVQVAAVIVLVAFTPRIYRANWNPLVRFTLAGLLLLCLLPLLHLIPLPETLWAKLPGRLLLAELSGVQTPKPALRLFSLSPVATIHSLFFILTPIAVFLGVLLMDYNERRRACLFILGFSLFSVILGIMQMFGGPSSSLYFFSFTNNYSPVGFFSNRNHLAALLYCSLPLAIAFALALSSGGGWRRKHCSGLADYFAPLGLIIAILLLVLGAALTTSFAGVSLAIVAIIVTFLNLLFRNKGRIRAERFRLLAAILVVAVSVGVFYALDKFLARSTVNSLQDARAIANQLTWQAAVHFFPFGTGMGTFQPVYKLFETVQTVAPTTMNRAHNEYFEWLLEAGALAVIMFLLVLIWLGAAVVRAWTHAHPGQSQTDQNLMLASVNVPFLLFVHSLVDYPLRTAAIAALAAFCCAMTMPPLMERELGRE